jgi:hypothetical protein
LSEKSIPASELAAAFREALQSVQPEPVIDISNRIPRSPWDAPVGQKKSVLTRKVSLNGHDPNPRQLHSEEIDLINQLREGVFCNGQVTVTTIRRGRDAVTSVKYPSSTPDKRMNFGMNLKAMLAACVREAGASTK